jgi:hypothetical protein
MLGRRTATIAATIPVFEDRDLAFASLQQAANVFLVSEKHQQTYRNGENSIKMFRLIKDD